MEDGDRCPNRFTDHIVGRGVGRGEGAETAPLRLYCGLHE